MNQNNQRRFIFSKQLSDIVLENHYIPRKIKHNEHFKQYHRYWSSFSEVYCKVLDIYFIKNIEYYSVKLQNSLFSELSYPLPDDYIFELLVDYKDLEHSWIINNFKLGSLTGAEIRYWFFIKDIDLNDPEYDGFWSYLDYTSKSSISDDKYYFVKMIDTESGRKFKISLDRYKK